MKSSYLQVTYRKGRALAAYFYLPRRGDDCSARTEKLAGGVLLDYAQDGRAIGIEITSPGRLDLAKLNEQLVLRGLQTVQAEDLAPLLAA